MDPIERRVFMQGAMIGALTFVVEGAETLLTPGQAYEVCDNGNRSAVHWDMVLIQRPEWGGGEVWFDGELIRKNGMFLPKDLKGLNPKNLK